MGARMSGARLSGRADAGREVGGRRQKGEGNAAGGNDRAAGGVQMARAVADPRKVTHADVVSSCRFYLKVLGAFEVKIWGGPMQRAGLPDILACVKDKDGHGRWVAVEAKVGRDKMRPAQLKVKAEIEAAGGIYINAKEGGAVDVEARLVAEGLAIPCLI